MDPLRRVQLAAPPQPRILGRIDVQLSGRRTIALTAWGTADDAVDSIALVAGQRAAPGAELTAAGPTLTLPADAVPEVRAALAKLTRRHRR